MDFKEQIQQLAGRVEQLKENILTEEATKNAFIMPFLTSLGYDVFNPLEVVPEMCCDIGAKKGEKIDYAIMKDGEPVILIECKHWQQDLNLHDNQLLRYYTVSKAKFGILTNGIIYRFYTDLKETNKMDEKPFLELNLLDYKDAQLEEVKKFRKSVFDVENILNTASELKYMGELKNVISKELNNPSLDFVKYFGKMVYDGVFTAKVSEQFTSLVKRTISSYINDIISDRLKAAMQNSANNEEAKEEVANNEVVEPENKIITTEEEMQAFYIVKAILRNSVPSDKIAYRDTQSYFSVLYDDNNRKPICRIYLNSETNKKIGIIDDTKKEVTYKIDSLDDIYNHIDELIASAKKYL